MENKKAKILVVDDEPEIVGMLKDLLSFKGYEVIDASSGEEALNILERETVDLILMDVMMPGLKGTDAARIIKIKYPDIKVIILTGHPDIGSSLLKENILDGIFMKPLRAKELFDKLVSIFNAEEKMTLSLQPKQPITARVLFIKAKLLFAEPSPKIYDFLKTHFDALAAKGENYTLEAAASEEQFKEKITSFDPDILLVNTSFFSKHEKNIIPQILQEATHSKEIIVYNIKNMDAFHDPQNIELSRLTKNIQTTCFMKGFIEFKLIEI